MASVAKSFRRLIRRRKKQVTAIGSQAEMHLERNFMRRFERLLPVRRFVAGWLALVILLVGCVVVQARALDGYHLSLQPAAGGIYSEGMVDAYSNASPLYATGLANSSVSKLLFAGLFTYDEHSKLIGDLAETWQVDPTGRHYTVRLRDHLSWHDGVPLTAEDVAFTYHTIQNPDVQSPLNVSWQDVKVAVQDPRTVSFDLPNPLSSFPYSLTNGIVPRHKLQDVKAANMRSAQFNTTRPVGAGPFKLRSIEVHGNSASTRQQEISLVPFENYHAGAPKVASFIVRTFPNETAMTDSFRKQTITAMVRPQDIPDEIRKDSNTQVLSMPLTAANMVFFKTTAGPLQEAPVRQALVAAADINGLTEGLPKPVLPVRSPLLQSSQGFDARYQQRFEGSERAASMLQQAGWLVQPGGKRLKAGKALVFKLYAQDSTENAIVTRRLQQQWKKIGVDAQVFLQSDADLPTTVANHSYDALLYGISLGVDPDEYVYWHSKQADVRSPSRLNFSEYSSAIADTALEAGRTRTDQTLRSIKYQPFLQAWQADAPALGLYQPYFTYVTRGQVYGFSERMLTQTTDRFNTVQDWMVRRVPQPIE